ncbi:hypothetical protein DFH06DRAFT_1331118 [Mycena polygramma]|nr:hypothetical protein DFH06DRAFT_1331118 [Mycena polygramma]
MLLNECGLYDPVPRNYEPRDTVMMENEKHLDQGSYQQEPILRQRERFQLNVFLRKLIGWPAIVIGGLTVLQSGAWSLFGYVERRQFIALPYTSAVWVQNNPHIITLIATQIFTILSACSSLLFSWGLYQSVILHMRGEGMPLSHFVSSVKISSRGLILNRRKLKWSVMSLVVFIVAGLQTTGWSGLLTPQLYYLSSPLSGHELDLSSPLLQQLDSPVLDYCIVNSTKRSFCNLNAFIVGQTESGSAAVKGHQALLTLMDQTFNISTAGILPLTLDDIDASTWFTENNSTNLSATIQADIVLPLDDSVSANYSLVQQGFTADVDCLYQDLDENTTPALFFQNDTVKDWNNAPQSVPVTYSNMSSNCSVPILPGSQVNTTSAYTAGTPNYILMIGCLAFEGNYALIFVGSGRYDFMKTMVCTFSPRITQVRVDYSDADAFSGTISTTTLTEGVPDNGGPASLSAVNTIYNMQSFAQATYTNIMGDELISILGDGGLDDDQAVLGKTAEYIRGVTEYSGSVFRACLSLNGSDVTFVQGVPAGMSTPTNGTFTTEIAGWLHVSVATFWELLPGTFIALATICTVLVTVARHVGDLEGELFDPSNTMHLVSVSAAGGLDGVFKGTHECDIEAAENVQLFLGPLPGRELALKVRGAV